MEQYLAEQAERTARLALRNDILFWGTLIGMTPLLLWIIRFAVRFIKSARQQAAESGDFLSFTCLSCGKEFSVPLGYLVKHPFIPQKSVTVNTPLAGGVVRLSRRLRCPVCEKKTWCWQDLAESYPIAVSHTMEALKKELPGFLLGVAALLLANGLFQGVVRLIFR